MTPDDVPVSSLWACAGLDIRVAKDAMTAVVVGHRFKDGTIEGISVRFYDADGNETNNQNADYPGHGHDVVYAWAWNDYMRANKLRMMSHYHNLEELVERERPSEGW